MENGSSRVLVAEELCLNESQKERLSSIVDSKPKFYSSSESDWFEVCKDYDIICPNLKGINSEKLYDLSDKYFSLAFVDTSFLDFDRLNKRNIKVSNSPGSNSEAVVEWIVGMLLMKYRRLDEFCRVTEDNNITKTSPGLYGKRMTILSEGNVGKHLGEVSKALGMNVNYFRRNENLYDSCLNSDIVVNCLCLNKTTNKLLDEYFFYSLKKGSFFVNVSRSSTYDLPSLKKSIDDGILIGAADDCSDILSGDINSLEYKTLLEHPKIYVTPHVAWNSDYNRSIDKMIDNVEAWIYKSTK